MQELMPWYFSVKKGLYHYLNMAKGNYKTYLRNDQVRVKKYFYILRPLLAAEWILERESAPPMRFEDLVDTKLPIVLKPVVEDLVKQKKTGFETELMPQISELNQYFENSFQKIEEIVKTKKNPEAPWEPLEEYFLNTIIERRPL